MCHRHCPMCRPEAWPIGWGCPWGTPEGRLCGVRPHTHPCRQRFGTWKSPGDANSVCPEYYADTWAPSWRAPWQQAAYKRGTSASHGLHSTPPSATGFIILATSLCMKTGSTLLLCFLFQVPKCRSIQVPPQLFLVTEMKIEISLSFYSPRVFVMHGNHILRVIRIMVLMVIYMHCLVSFICIWICGLIT